MTTPILGLDEWQQAQAQPHVTVNTALRWLECFSALSVIDRDLTAPPGSPNDGDVYIPAPGASGDWAGHAHDVALFLGNAWAFKTAPLGTIAYIQDEDQHVYYTGDSPGAWTDLP